MKKLIIDIREPNEFNSESVEGSVNIPLADIYPGSDKLNNIPLDSELILYCRSGNRSSNAISSLEAMGYTNLKNGINKENVEKLFF